MEFRGQPSGLSSLCPPCWLAPFSLHVGPGTWTEGIRFGSGHPCLLSHLTGFYFFFFFFTVFECLAHTGVCSGPKLCPVPLASFNGSDLSFAATYTLINLCYPYASHPLHTCLSVHYYCKLIYWLSDDVLQSLFLYYSTLSLCSSLFWYCIAFKFFAMKSYLKILFDV